jgi:hypothetical protein
MKAGSRVLDARLMASNFYIAQLRFFWTTDGYGLEKRALRSVPSSTDATNAGGASSRKAWAPSGPPTSEEVDRRLLS